MTQAETTCWTVIQGAAEGQESDVSTFVKRYGPIVQAYLEARWKGSPLRSFADDAAQEVLIECFREGGVLVTAQQDRVVSFRAFLLGVVRNVARRFEARKQRAAREEPAETGFDVEDPKARDNRLSVVFDRAWAESIVREAASRQRERAAIMGDAALKRVELLDLRFNEGLPVRDIAARWGAELKWTHHEFDRARREFEEALQEVMRFHYPGEMASAEREIARLLELLAR